ncbi:MAG TPA: nuclear transport factor 2 family protein [Candidatus Peribacterales bacterium]|nr:nuclear transport factor 2 family protein [Candidatus Peribacterales bacterium]
MKSSSHKDTVLSFLHLAVAGDIWKAYNAYIHPDFRHHNAYYKGDRESLMVGMEENHKQFPAKAFDVKRILEEGDIVITHSSITLTGMAEIAVVHIFRFQDEKIIEMWDLGQEVPKDMPNENGMF